MDTTVKLKDNTLKELEKLREHKRESWDDLVQKLIKFKKMKNNNKQ